VENQPRGGKVKQTKIYQYDACNTCRKALKYLDGLGIRYEKIPIAAQAPDKAELTRALKALNGKLRGLFNTSGKLYREMQLSQKINAMDSEEALALLSKHGMLVKRPFLLSEKGVLIGFKAPEWDAFFKA